jgi:hypothetical protein
MSTPILIAHAHDAASIEALAAAIRVWEPRLDLIAALEDSMIYEPDGTLYAVALAPEVTLLARHKARVFRLGDMAIIPRAVAIDAEEPGASYIAIRHEGDPPYHFRERFIQTWAFEHRPAATIDPETGFDDVITPDDLRFRVPYRRVALGNVGRGVATEFDLHLWVGLEGRARLATAGSSRAYEIGPGNLALVGAGVDYSIEGQGVAGRWLLSVESAHEARLAAASAGQGGAEAISPEFRPGG